MEIIIEPLCKPPSLSLLQALFHSPSPLLEHFSLERLASELDQILLDQLTDPTHLVYWVYWKLTTSRRSVATLALKFSAKLILHRRVGQKEMRVLARGVLSGWAQDPLLEVGRVVESGLSCNKLSFLVDELVRLMGCDQLPVQLKGPLFRLVSTHFIKYLQTHLLRLSQIEQAKLNRDFCRALSKHFDSELLWAYEFVYKDISQSLFLRPHFLHNIIVCKEMFMTLLQCGPNSHLILNSLPECQQREELSAGLIYNMANLARSGKVQLNILINFFRFFNKSVDRLSIGDLVSQIILSLASLMAHLKALPKSELHKEVNLAALLVLKKAKLPRELVSLLLSQTGEAWRGGEGALASVCVRMIELLMSHFQMKEQVRSQIEEYIESSQDENVKSQLQFLLAKEGSLSRQRLREQPWPLESSSRKIRPIRLQFN